MSEYDVDDEEYNSIYENEETQDLINVRELLKSKTLEELLKEDREKIKTKEKEKQWYHGRITRDVAEDIIKKGFVLLFKSLFCIIYQVPLYKHEKNVCTLLEYFERTFVGIMKVGLAGSHSKVSHIAVTKECALFVLMFHKIC